MLHRASPLRGLSAGQKHRQHQARIRARFFYATAICALTARGSLGLNEIPLRTS